MFAGIRKSIQTRYLFYILSILIILMLVLSSGFNLLHNHEPDFKYHQDCSAYQIYLLLSTIIVSCYTFSLTICFLTFFQLCQHNTVDSFLKYTFNSRAPPFQILKNPGRYLKRQQFLQNQDLKRSNPCLRTLKFGAFPHSYF